MQKTQLSEIKLVGISIRMNNAQIDEHALSNPTISMFLKYFNGGFPDKIADRKNPGITFCVYTNYETDFAGDYTYFIGEEVTSFEQVSEGFECLTIPAQQYVKFTNDPKSPAGIDILWPVWKMGGMDLGVKRAYVADFEVYDQRSADPNKTILDVYIGIKE